MSAFDFSPFVGLAWREKGRGPEGYDCWGLFAAAFAAASGIALARHDDYGADRDETARILAGATEEDWITVLRGQERYLDGVLMRIGGRYHIGLVTRPGSVLHMPREKTSVIEPLARFERCVTAIYRHRQLCGPSA